MEETFVIELQKVSKAFNGEWALQNIHLQVNRGEFLTLLGPSGCGKTTILRLIAGFESATSGSLFINGENVSTVPPEYRQVNTIFQNYALFPHLTVFDNVAFGPRLKKWNKEKIKQQVTEILRMVQLEALAHRKPHQLSGGQQQRVAIARAVVNHPLVLLLDEPLSALDYKLRKNMQIELKQLQRRLGITFIFVTHDQEEALSMSDRIAVLNAGKIEQIGTPKEIYENPANLFVARFVGESNLLTGEIVATQENNCQVRLANQILSLPTTKSLIGQDKVHVLLRPEDLRVWSAEELGDTQQAIPGVVEEIIYKGTTVDLLVRLEDGQQLFATEFFDEADPKLDYNRGEQVFVNWVKGWEVILPYEE